MLSARTVDTDRLAAADRPPPLTTSKDTLNTRWLGPA